MEHGPIAVHGELSDEQIRELARIYMTTSPSIRKAAERLGVTRNVFLGLVSGAPTRPATFSLIRERNRKRTSESTPNR